MTNRKDYSILSADKMELSQIYQGFARVKGIYLSSVAMVVELEVDNACAGSHANVEEKVRSQVQILMRSLRHRLLENGVDCPAIVVIRPPSGSLSSHASLKAYLCLSSDQDWHRGEFSVWVESSFAAAERRIEDLLVGEVPKSKIAPDMPSYERIIDKCAEEAEGNPTLKSVLEALKEKSAGDEDDSISAHKLRSHLAPLHEEVNALGKEVDLR